jgi:hypothetical protein
VAFSVIGVVVNPSQYALPDNIFVLHVQLICSDYCLQLLYRQSQQFFALLPYFHKMAHQVAARV